jgi:endonuclease-8
VPEGDTIFRAATSLRRWLVGRELTEVRTTVPGLDAPQLVGRCVEAVDTRGKHLLIRCGGGLAIHSHMRMTGSWHCYPTGEEWRRSASRARLVLVCGDRLAVCFDAPVIEVLDAARERLHPVLRTLGPDLLATSDPDPAAVVRRARLRSQTAPSIGELLLDQQVVAGVGNIYRCEALFACGVYPATPAEEVPDERLLEIIATAMRLLRANAAPGGAGARSFAPRGTGPRDPWVYRRAGRPCRRCGTLIRRSVLGRQARSVYWCPRCQAPNAR